MNKLYLIVPVFLIFVGSLGSGCFIFPVKPVYSGENGLALEGYDPVAYFVEKKAIKGKNEIFLKQGSRTWLFSKEENKTIFAANPEKYIPAYGGYCSYGMTFGLTIKTDPTAWHIHEGRLYLNNTHDTKKTWLKKKKGYIKRANTFWSKYRKKKD